MNWVLTIFAGLFLWYLPFLFCLIVVSRSEVVDWIIMERRDHGTGN